VNAPPRRPGANVRDATPITIGMLDEPHSRRGSSAAFDCLRFTARIVLETEMWGSRCSPGDGILHPVRPAIWTSDALTSA
jgi:hypothetical protein